MGNKLEELEGYEKALEALRHKQALEALRYRWLRRELVAGRERDISEGLNTEQELDDYIYKRMFDDDKG
jgi:hypothetical protein